MDKNLCMSILNYDELVSKCLELSGSLFMDDRMNSIVTPEHKFYWAWIGELFYTTECFFSHNDKPNLSILFLQNLKLLLSHHGGADGYIRYIDINDSLIVSYLIFPYLEFLLKKMNSEFVDMDGKVKKEFLGSSKNGSNSKYAPKKGGKNKCSSIEDLLFLLFDQASNSLKTRLEEFDTISKSKFGKHLWALIGDWRNTTLHGQTNYMTIGGFVFNICSIIMLDTIKDQFEQVKLDSADNFKFRLSTRGYKYFPYGFYPPIYE